MPPELQKVFAYLQEFGPCAIFGSAVWRYDSALDIDVLFPNVREVNFPNICRELGIKYCGWDRQTEHLRVTRDELSIPGISKPVHLSWSSRVHHFTDHPFSCLLADGTETKPGIYLTIRKGERDSTHTYVPGDFGTSTYDHLAPTGYPTAAEPIADIRCHPLPRSTSCSSPDCPPAIDTFGAFLRKPRV